MKYRKIEKAIVGERRMKKNSFILAVIMVVATFLINKFPNPNQLEFIDVIKLILAMISSVLSLVFMIMSFFCSKSSFAEMKKFKIVKISLLLGIVLACMFVIGYVMYI